MCCGIIFLHVANGWMISESKSDIQLNLYMEPFLIRLI